ncbi:MAG: hypothetical protein WCO28_03585, partial [Bacteroidota bacterium]
MKARIYKKVIPFFYFSLIGILFMFLPKVSLSQAPSCSSGVPFYLIDLRGNPVGVWKSPSFSRTGSCCTGSNCCSFEIYLDSGATGVNFEISSGAVPSGSMYYQIDCGPQIAVGSMICISGTHHYITFCKPGNNPNTYRVTSIPKPLFPKDDTTRVGCSLPINLYGFDPATVTISSIYPGTPGQYNSKLSCTTGCLTPIFTPDSLTPPYIDYYICGTPSAQQNQCGYLLRVCDTVRIYTMPKMISNASPNPASFCSGGSGVLLTGTATGGDGNYSYKWKNSGGTVVSSIATFLANVAGTYTLTVDDGLSSATCPASYAPASVSSGTVPIVSAGSDQHKCASDPITYLNGSIQYATGGTWTGGSGTFSPNATNLLASYLPTRTEIANHSVVLTLTSTGAGGGCTNQTDQVTIFFNDTLKISLTAPTISCHNDTVVLSSSITGGTSPYNYLWSTGETSTIINATHGAYTLNVTDFIGCKSISTKTLTSPAAISLSMSSTDITTNGGSNGTATAIPSGGTSPYSYLWNSGHTMQTDTGRSYGIATVSVTDTKGCKINGSVVVNEPRCLGFQASISHSNVTCYGGNNSNATASISGGTAPYRYQWNDPLNQTTQTATNLYAANYTLTVTDTNGCLDIVSVVITQPTKLIGTITHTDNTVIGAASGSATANPSGGTPPYYYLWNTIQTTQTITGLVKGNYRVTVLDANDCAFIDSINISEPPCNNFNIYTTVIPVTCKGETNGKADVITAHGTAPYSYNWNTSPVQTTDSATNLGAGVYTVTVIDSTNCSNFQTATITEPDRLTISLAKTNIRCNGTHDGTIDLTVSGGTFPYTFHWSNSITVEDLVGLAPGKYVITVTDANGCSRTDSAEITQPPVLAISVTGHNVTCNAGNDGSIDATISGGVLPYTYLWSNAATTQDISSLTYGAYKLTVTDANTCISEMTASLLVNQPEVVAVSNALISCPSASAKNALVTITPKGGNGNLYSVSFDNGANFQTPGLYTATLPADSSYYIVVKDSTGCISPVKDTVKIKPVVKITGVRFDSCLLARTATTLVTITPSGGDATIYQLSYDSGATYQTAGVYAFNLAINHTYSIIAKDTSGCTSLPFEIQIPDTLSITSTLSNYNGSNISCNGSSNGAIDITVTRGTAPYTYAWNNSATTQDISGLGAGFYRVIVTDHNGCSRRDSFTLTQPDTLSLAAISSNYNGSSVSCNGATNGSIDITITKGTAPYSYAWNNSATTQDISGLGAGFYRVIVTDNNGCSVRDSFTLTQPEPLTLAAITSNYHGSSVSCNGSTNGSIDITITKGTAPYTYAWNNSATTQDISGLGAGFYRVIVTDNNGCSVRDSFTLTQPDTLTLAAITSNYNGSSVSCNGSTNGSIDITITKGTAPYT